MAESVNLIPQLSEYEVQEIEEKGKINFYAVFFVFFVVLFSLVILGANLALQLDYNQKNEVLSDKKSEIVKLQYVEIKQKTLNNKFETFEAIEDRDFYSDIVLEYLLDVLEQLSTVESLTLSQTLEFQVSGRATSYRNVARLWHDMSRQEDYFEYVNLGSANKIRNDDETEGNIKFSFNGAINPETVDKISQDREDGQSDQ